MKCWAIDKECRVELEEIPLAICELCIKAYISRLKHPVIKRRKAERSDMNER